MSKFVLLTAAFLIAGGDQLEWRWSKEKASLEYSIKKHLPDFDVELVREKEFYTPINICSKNGRKIVYATDHGHLNMVFARSNGILYIADFCPIATGCNVVALDLGSAKQLWKTQLEGIGLAKHSKYSNSVNIETDGKRIIVYGNESHGKYVEVLDIKTGETLTKKKVYLVPNP